MNDLVLARIDHLPILLAATFRPEFQPPWVGQAHVTVIALNRLGCRDGAVMVAREGDLPEQVLLVAPVVAIREHADARPADRQLTL